MNDKKAQTDETPAGAASGLSTGFGVAHYSEDGHHFLVDVLADNSDSEWHKFDLRQHETNETFSVSWKKSGGYCDGMWRLCFEDGRIVP